MTVAWYGHLKYKKAPLIATIFVSWGIAFFEYIFQYNYKLGRKMRHFLVLMANFSFEAVSDSNAAGWNIRNSDF